jgi:hypothetical protein
LPKASQNRKESFGNLLILARIADKALNEKFKRVGKLLRGLKQHTKYSSVLVKYLLKCFICEFVAFPGPHARAHSINILFEQSATVFGIESAEPAKSSCEVECIDRLQLSYKYCYVGGIYFFDGQLHYSSTVLGC